MNDPSSAERLLLVQRALDSFIDRRIAGETIDEADILSQHPELLPELRDELRNLRVIERARRRAASSAGGSSAAIPDLRSAEPAPPDLFPGYDVLHEIHRGGQGVVYQAVQRATKRTVAIKVVRQGGLASRNELLRFEREVQVLAGLRHPHIVTIHDSGVAAGGTCYFVMDYIEGAPLDAYTDRHRTDGLAATLELFVKVCDAVNAAHLRGVIHRDIKPSNIRVDKQGEPRVLDFGLAKLIGEESGELRDDSTAAHMTATGQFVGSLPWASPEQARGRAIDLRTDVYSLGVVLYQMLTAQMPYDVTGELRDVLERIVTAPPRRPRTLRSDINDELDTILMTCLAKEPERRYQSAGELARDVRRYVAGEPIEAKRDSATYMLRKSLRRYRGALAVAATFVVLIAASAVALSFLYVGQSHAREDAQQQATLAEVARATAAEEAERASAEAARANTEAARAGKVIDLLQGMLASADPHESKGKDYTVRELLDEFSDGLEDQLADQPEVEATVRTTIGGAYRRLAEYDKAEVHLSRALELRRELYGDEDERVAESMNHYAWVLHDRDDNAGAERLFRESLAIQRARLGDDHVDVAETMNSLAEVLRHQGRTAEAADLILAGLEIFRANRGEEHTDIAANLHNLAANLEAEGDLVRAERTYTEALAMRRRLLGDHPLVAVTANNLAGVLRTRGELDRAEALYDEVLDILRAHLGDEHPNVATGLNNLAMLRATKGDFAGAEPLYREAIAIFRKVLGDEHPAVGTLLNNLAGAIEHQGRVDEAEALYREALALHRKAPGDGVNVVATLTNLAMIHRDRDELDEAESLAREALAISQRVLSAGHPRVAKALHNLGTILHERGDTQETERLYREALAINRAALGERSPAVGADLNGLASLAWERGDYAEAEPLHRQAVDILSSTLGADHADTIVARSNLARCLESLGEADEAIALLRELMESRRRRGAEQDDAAHQDRQRLGDLLRKTGAAGEADEVLEEDPATPDEP